MPASAAKRIQLTQSRLTQVGYGWFTLLFSLPFIAIGSYLALGGLGYLPLSGKVHAPLWVVGAAGLSFAMGGVLLFSHSIAGLLQRRRRAALASRPGVRPWLLDYPWDPAGIDDPAANRWLSTLAMTLLLAIFLTPFNWWAFISNKGGLMVQLGIGLFDLILLLMVKNFLYRLGQHLKFGAGHLAFAEFPYAPGETLRAYFSPNRFDQLQLELRFVEEWSEVVRSGGKRRRHHSAVVHHSTRHTLPVRSHSGEVEIRLDLPANPEWVNQLRGEGERVYYWELLVEAEQPGIDYHATFLLPVYDRPRSAVVTTPRRAPIGTSRRLIPYAFELLPPLILAALVGVAWLLAPTQLERTAREVASSLTPIPWVPLTQFNSSALATQPGPDGQVWLLTKYELARLTPTGPKPLLDSPRYRQLFNHKLNALSTFTVIAQDEAWVASWYGELFHYQNGQWQERLSRGQPLARRIHALAQYAGALWLGGEEGLWRWVSDGPEEGLTPVAGLPKGAVRALAVDQRQRLLVALEREVWRLEAGEWQLHWRGAGRVNALAVNAAGGLLLATDHGLIPLDRDGVEGALELADHPLTALALSGTTLAAGDQEGGLHLRRDGVWEHYALGKRISGIAFDQTGGVVLTSYGRGVLVPR